MSDLGTFFDGYARDWNAFYDGDRARAFDYRNRQRLLLELVDRLAPAPTDVLELGCGAGHTAVRLSERGHRLSCVDVSPQMIAATERNFARAGAEATLHVGTVGDLPAERGSFDLVVAAGMMEYVEDRDATLAAIHGRLRPGGAAILSFTNAGSPMHWVETPIKRVLALGAYALTRRRQYRDIAVPASRADHLSSVRRLFERAGLHLEAAHFFTYGMRIGAAWWPPLWMVRRADGVLASSRMRSLGRGFFAVGRRPR